MNQSKRLALLLFLLSLLLVGPNVYGVQMKTQCVGAGGISGSGSDNYKVSATVGQTAIGFSKYENADTINLYHGFWNPWVITATDVEEQIELTLPKDFGISQNYPNPFNPQTVIEYAVARDSHVRIIVYNVLGQKVTVLKDEWEQAGYRSVTWDGKNQKREEVGTGIYFYKIQADDFVKTKKMVLLK